MWVALASVINTHTRKMTVTASRCDLSPLAVSASLFLRSSDRLQRVSGFTIPISSPNSHPECVWAGGHPQRCLHANTTGFSQPSVYLGHISEWASMVHDLVTWMNKSLCTRNRPSQSWQRSHTDWRHVLALGGGTGYVGYNEGCPNEDPSQPRVSRNSIRRGSGTMW